MCTNNATLAQWVALSLIPHLGSQTIARLLDRFGSLDAVLSASAAELKTVPGIGPKLAAAIRAADVPAVQAALASWLAEGIAVLQRDQPGYPIALRGLPDAPVVLFQRGALAPQDARAIAIVGTRRPSLQARQTAHALTAHFAARGWTVVSGLAAGIDTLAHKAALACGGRTLAVLGSGARVGARRAAVGVSPGRQPVGLGVGGAQPDHQRAEPRGDRGRGRAGQWQPARGAFRARAGPPGLRGALCGARQCPASGRRGVRHWR